jgi:hypothetical protein
MFHGLTVISEFVGTMGTEAHDVLQGPGIVDLVDEGFIMFILQTQATELAG